ncbi:hypothetical protein SEUCBS139899_003291 [Sporothrix eucalyptigena]
MTFCSLCVEMTLPGLVELAKLDFDSASFPNTYYHHHTSFQELEECASASGCPLCRVIVDSFENALHDPNNPTWPVPVRLGERLELGDPLRVPDLTLALRVPGTRYQDYSSLEKNLPVVDGYKVACATVDSNLASAANFGIARSWLDGCRHNHDQTTCTTTAYTGLPPCLPTRVIDVSSKPPRIVHAVDIHAGTPEQGCAEYVALSHCWGGPIETLLLHKTIKSFSKCLPADKDLPANFRDAMAITRALGISYLWIDSLCIIQDSVDDWRRESRVMGAVYSRATVSLLAMSSAASAEGILKETPKPKVPNCVMPFKLDDRTVTLRVETIFQDCENLRKLTESAPLSERGWCLQELVFSSRILFYGRDNIYWFCPQGGYKSTEGVPDGIQFPNNTYPSISSFYYGQNSKSSNGTLSTVESILTDFYHFVESYAQRRLTFGTDKFPAVSSFAQNVHTALENQGFNSEYMAGVWSGDFRRGLLYCPERMHAAHVVQADEKDGLYRAPSWSWAVTDKPIKFLAAETSLRGSSPLNLQLVSWKSDLRDSNNPFGSVDDAHMVVKGRTCTLKRSAKHFIGAYTWDKDEEEQGTAWFDDQPYVEGTTELVDTKNGNCVVFEGEDDTFLCTYYAPGDSTGERKTVHPDIHEFEEQEYKILMIDLGLQDDEDEDEELSDEEDWEMMERLIHCLILQHVPDNISSDNNVYKRVGCLVLEWKNREKVDDWDEETLKLV